MNQRSLFAEGGMPIYRQIAAQVRADILSGALASEDQVMSTNQYATFHRVNPATVAKAFQELVDEGLLYKRRGLGMFVTDGAPARLRADRRRAFRDEVLAPALDEARQLDIPLDEVIAALRTLASSRATAPASARKGTPSP